ncbi:protein FAM209 isoform X2 [Monodelphis domestica]|uniref:protein FAM209 isoform X2 n=1 Tax=Monodelphis domestica TaxID=13616 RepID=UPI0024E25239|nr:protein FAM209 isoform X2 [Monodelphis domestica]
MCSGDCGAVGDVTTDKDSLAFSFPDAWGNTLTMSEYSSHSAHHAYAEMLFVLPAGHYFRDKDLNSGSSPYRSLQKKNQNAAPNKDYALNTLTQLEMDLVTFVSKVRSLKVAMATGSSLKLPDSEVPSDPHNNITIYEIWGEDDSD